MKIIHTSDWHLGKRIEGKSRLPEQEAALEHLLRICREQHVDAVVVAGDVFDTVNPPADAEALFYSACLRLSRLCPVIAVAGNHDNPDRLSAPEGIAAECGILLGGGLDFSRAKEPFSGGEGYVRLRRGKETVNFALLPYPSPARMSCMGYEINAEIPYAQSVRDWLALCARGFTAPDCNITVSHLFMTGSERASDEVELGTAALLPPDVLPAAHYTALGHIHRPQRVGKTSAYYSGSLLQYAFDDTSEKFYNLLETSPVGVRVEKIPVCGGRRLVTVTAKSFEECITLLREHAGTYVRILYDCALPLSASKYAELRGCENFAVLKNIAMAPKAVQSARKTLSDRELFVAFYKTVHNDEQPDGQVLEMFERAMRGETI